jgi:hypothetical protein
MKSKRWPQKRLKKSSADIFPSDFMPLGTNAAEFEMIESMAKYKGTTDGNDGVF